MNDIIETVLHPIDTWRTTDNTVIYLAGYVVAAIGATAIAWGAWSFVDGLFSQAAMVAGI
jgi:hypothetical protein